MCDFNQCFDFKCEINSKLLSLFAPEQVTGNGLSDVNPRGACVRAMLCNQSYECVLLGRRLVFMRELDAVGLSSIV